jgi:hypothetical protein
MELSFIKDRQRAGIQAAKARGVYKGRPVTFDHAKIIALRKKGIGASEIARDRRSPAPSDEATSTKLSRQLGRHNRGRGRPATVIGEVVDCRGW